MNNYQSNKSADELFRVVLKLENLREARSFFRDLCTIEEIKNMADRWETAQMLKKGFPYREIAEKLKLSTTTVSRVAFWLNNGTGGYKDALDKLSAGKKSTHHSRSSFGNGQR